MISAKESYDLFIMTLSRLDHKNLEMSDEYLEHEIFEELYIDNHSFLHEFTVSRLIQEKLIPESVQQRIIALREQIILLMKTKHSIEEYRHDLDWKKTRNESHDLFHIIHLFSKNKLPD